jgi:hypothetical protein
VSSVTRVWPVYEKDREKNLWKWYNQSHSGYSHLNLCAIVVLVIYILILRKVLILVVGSLSLDILLSMNAVWLCNISFLIVSLLHVDLLPHIWNLNLLHALVHTLIQVLNIFKLRFIEMHMEKICIGFVLLHVLNFL